MRPTTPPTAAPVDNELAARLASYGHKPLAPSTADPVEPEPTVEPEQMPSKVSTPRKRKVPLAVADQANKRGLYLSDPVWDRLVLEARHRKTTASAIAEAILSKNLPKFSVTREG